MGCTFRLIHTIWTVQIYKATIARSEYMRTWKSRSEVQKYTQRRIIKLDTLDEFVKDNGSASYCQFKRLLYLICHQQEFFSLYTPWYSLASRKPRSMWVLTSTSALLKAILIIDNTLVIIWSHTVYTRHTAIKIHIFKIKVVLVRLILFKL